MGATTLKQPRLHAGHMEVAIAGLIGWRQHVIVPNVSWGLGLGHECDLLVLDGKNRLTEVEIKVSKQDLRKDFEKGHGHRSSIISRLVYAVPAPLVEYAAEIVPARCGIIAVAWDEHRGLYVGNWMRRCKYSKAVAAIKPETAAKLMRLGCMRIWTLKAVLNRKHGV